ncbi:ABC transporter substrate-binding protein [Marvinbryantia formatexigens DSM 14469]|nr:ABC transporter substrate-binding protein [Marvinbryantia formatexigens]UWO23342.1 ABC transporter substrate-binding protein [Marvinbryantia formatexigens DSM 14469]
MRRVIAAGAALLLCGGCAATDEQEREVYTGMQEMSEVDENLIVVGFSQVGSESDWRNAHTQSVKEALTEENGFYLIFEDAQQKQENQIKAVRSFILQEVDYIVLAPIVETGWEAVLQEAKDAGIPVILDDRLADVDEELYTCWVGTNAEKEGEDAGLWLADYLEKEGRDEEEINIVTVQGTAGATAQIGRTDGFQKILKQHDNWKMLDRMDGDFTQAKGQEVMETLLAKYDDIDVVVCENDNMAFGAVDAIRAAGRTCGPDGDIIIISFDAVSAAFDAMIAGEINAVFECNPLHGPKLQEIITSLEAGKTVDKIQYMEEAYFDTTMDLESIRKERAY